MKYRYLHVEVAGNQKYMGILRGTNFIFIFQTSHFSCSKKCLQKEGRRLPPLISRHQWPETGRPMPPARPFDILVDCCGGGMPKEFRNPNSNPGKSQRQQHKEGGEEGWEGKEKMRRLPERPEMIQSMKTGLLDLQLDKMSFLCDEV
jgi:hypothetical protein